MSKGIKFTFQLIAICDESRFRFCKGIKPSVQIKINKV